MSYFQYYTTRASRFVYRYPRVNVVLIQINYWLITFVLLCLINYFQIKGILLNSDFSLPPLYTIILVAIAIGIIFGLITGVIDLILASTRVGTRVNQMRMYKVIIIKSSLYLVSFVVAWQMGLLAAKHIIQPMITMPFNYTSENFRQVFFGMLLYVTIATILLNFIKQMNNSFGPGVLLPLFFGRYRHPQFEERVFLFMDLKGSTPLAEEMSLQSYSKFIRDCFGIINRILPKYLGQVYQYVGDEIVVSWEMKDGNEVELCLHFFRRCSKILENKKDYFLAQYGVVPQFKAGMHLGIVTAIEVGEIKREIAFHGNTINTASRIQTLCNQYQTNLLISDDFRAHLPDTLQQEFKYCEEIIMKGKKEKIGIWKEKQATLLKSFAIS